MKKLLYSLSFGLLIMSVGCSEKAPTNPDKSTNPTVENKELTNVTLFDFQIVYENDVNIIDSVKDLNKNIEMVLGTKLTTIIDTDSRETSNYEIIIGNVSNSSSNDILSQLDENTIIIKSISTDSSMKYIIGGNSKENTIFAINEFINLLNNDEIFNFETGYVYKDNNYTYNINDFYVPYDDLKKTKIFVSEMVDENVKTCVELFVNDLNKVLGSNLMIEKGNYETDLTSYDNIIVFGPVGEESTNMESRLQTNSYYVKSIPSSKGTKIFVMGSSNQEIINGIQYLYKNSVINQELDIHKYINKYVESIERRDPCILPYNGVYYLYTSTSSGFQVEKSSDLLSWTDQTIIFQQSWDPNFKGIGDYWAPECHYYNGQFYLFVTYKSSKTGHRGCAILKSSTPDGKFELITDDHITPSDWDAIDGTLYVDKTGQPYMVFVHEWTSMPDGNGLMCYAKLSDDLTHFISEPVTMFKSTDPEWTDECVTDGPYMYRCEDGTLLMIWSNFASKGFSGYTIGLAVSSNGEIDGDWIQINEPLHWDDDKSVYKILNGGHGMIFKGFDNRTYITFHSPNSVDIENHYLTKVMCIPIIENNGLIKIDLVK